MGRRPELGHPNAILTSEIFHNICLRVMNDMPCLDRGFFPQRKSRIAWHFLKFLYNIPYIFYIVPIRLFIFYNIFYKVSIVSIRFFLTQKVKKLSFFYILYIVSIVFIKLFLTDKVKYCMRYFNILNIYFIYILCRP